MKRFIEIFLDSLVPQRVINMYKKQRDLKKLEEWKRRGQPVPPPHCVKQLTIAEYQEKYGHQLFIETGTYKGEMVEAQIDRFERIISIELDDDLYLKAKGKFKNNRKVKILHGDSSKVLREILSEINEPAIFWLDAHYSGEVTARGDKECPIYEELETILTTKCYNHVILIDDARCFNGTHDYPTLESLKEFISLKNGQYCVENKNDIICCEREK